MRCPTVKVKFDNEQGFYIINECDFDKDLHELFTENSDEIKKGSKAWYAAKLTDASIEFDVDAKLKDLKALLEDSE